MNIKLLVAIAVLVIATFALIHSAFFSKNRPSIFNTVVNVCAFGLAIYYIIYYLIWL